MTQSREIVSLRRRPLETPCSHDIFRVDRNYAAASARKERAQLCLKNFFFSGVGEVGNTTSLRSDIRLPKLTSARTCSRYEKLRPVVFPVPPSPSLEDNERMRRAENEIRRHRPGESGENVTTRTRDSSETSEKLCRVAGDASPDGWLMQQVKRLPRESCATCRFYEPRYLHVYIQPCDPL